MTLTVVVVIMEGIEDANKLDDSRDDNQDMEDLMRTSNDVESGLKTSGMRVCMLH